MTTSVERVAADLLSPQIAPWDVASCECLADSDVLVVLAVQQPATLGVEFGDVTRDQLQRLGADLAALAEIADATAHPGELSRVPLGNGSATLLLVVGVGAGSPEDLRSAGAAVGRATRGKGSVATIAELASCSGEEPTEIGWAAYVEGVILGQWPGVRWDAQGVHLPAAPSQAQRLVVPSQGATPAALAAEIRRTSIRARATLVARGLVAVPSDVKNPAWLADQAREVAKRAGLEVNVLDETGLRQQGFGGVLTVGAGSASPPRLVQLDYLPAQSTPKTARIVLVGKGITFDTGGLDLKPREGMLAMKTDMAAAAAVLATMAACRELGVTARVTALLPMAENAVSGSSYRPGDVLTQFGGTTVEINNTDAEGRLLLADCLAYADMHLDPDIIVDLATLTGAARVALARWAAPVYTTDDDLKNALVSAGQRVGEMLWPFPLATQYRHALDSDIADLMHTGSSGSGGSIVAALFLREFVGERRWAHLDIAGTGRSDADTDVFVHGGTGFGARLLLSWLEGLK